MRKTISIGFAFFLFLTLGARISFAENFEFNKDYSDVSYFDWRNSNPLDKESGTSKSILTPIRNQGGYGTCWCFALLAAAESQLRLQYAEQGLEMPDTDYSERYTVWNTYAKPLNNPETQLNITTYYQDEQGKPIFFTDPTIVYNSGETCYCISTIDQTGLVNEKDCPYRTRDMKAVNDVITPVNKVKEYYNLSNFNNSYFGAMYLQSGTELPSYDISLKNNSEIIKQLISKFGPGAVNVDVYPTCFDGTDCYSSANQEPSELVPHPYPNHSVTLVGWDNNYDSSSKYKTWATWCKSSLRNQGYIEAYYHQLGFKLILNDDNLPAYRLTDPNTPHVDDECYWYDFLVEDKNGNQSYEPYKIERIYTEPESKDLIWLPSETPHNNGAWIFKNSFGNYYGNENGYGYLSYEDLASCEFTTAIVETDNGKYPIVHNHANFVPSLYIADENNPSQVEYGSKYTTDSANFLKAISLHVNDINMNFELAIFKGEDTTGDLVYSQAGKFGENGLEPYAGRRLIDLEKYVFLDKDQNYFVSIKLGNESGKFALIPLVGETRYSNFVSNSGLSLFYIDGEWQDTTSLEFGPALMKPMVAMGTWLKATQEANGGDFTVTSLNDNSSGESIINLGKAEELYGLDSLYPDKKTLSNMTIYTEKDKVDTYAGAIIGEGKVIKEGAGTQILAGLCNWSGGLEANDGILRIKSDLLTSSVKVGQKGAFEASPSSNKSLLINGAIENNGTLLGNISLSDSLRNNNMFYPGDKVNDDNTMLSQCGQIMVAENFEQTEAGKTILDVKSEASDQIIIKSKATLAGAYDLKLDGKLLPLGEYVLKLSDFISAEEYEYIPGIIINGFGYENEQLAVEALEQIGLDGYKFKTTYKEGFVDKVKNLADKFVKTRRGIDFFKKSSNKSPINEDAQKIYLRMHENLLEQDSKITGNIRASLSPDAPLGDKVMDASNPGFVNNAMSAAVARARILTDTITERIINKPDLKLSKDGNTYAVPIKYQAKQKENSETAAWRDNTNGMFAGIEKKFGKWTHGIEIGKLDGKLTSMGTSETSSDVDTTFIGWHAFQQPDKNGFYLFSQLRYTNEEYSNERWVSSIGDSIIDASAGLYKSEFDIKSLNFTIGGAWNKHTGRTKFTPMIALNYSKYSRDGFWENGVNNQGLAINMNSDDYHRLVSTFGFSVNRVYNYQDRRRAALATPDGKNNNYQLYSNAKIALSFSAYYNHAFNNNRQKYNYNMIISDLEECWKPQYNEDSLDLRVGAAVITSENFSASLGAARHFGLKGYTDNRYTLSFDWKF